MLNCSRSQSATWTHSSEGFSDKMLLLLATQPLLGCKMVQFHRIKLML